MATDPMLFVKISSNIEDLKTAMAQARQAVIEQTEATKAATEATGGWSSVLDTLGGSFVARVAEGVLLRDVVHELLGVMKEAIGAFPELLEHTISVGNALFEMAVKTGSSVEGLSALRYVASQTGVDFNSFGTTISMLEKNLGATGQAGEKVGEVLNSMGLDLATVKSLRSDEAFTTIAHALFEVGNNADKAHDAALLMGRGAKEMAVLWHEDIGPMIEEAKDLGLVMSTETAAGAHLAEIGFKSLEMQLEAVGMHIANAFLPAIIGIEGDLNEGLTEAVKTLNAQLGATGGSGGTLALVAQAMGTGDEAIKAQIALYESLKTGLIAVVRNGLEPLVSAIAYGMVGFDATKVIIGDVVQVINYLALGYEKVILALDKMEVLTTRGAERDYWKGEVSGAQATIDALGREMTARAGAIAANKRAEGDWLNWSTAAHTAIEVSLNAIGAAHTDVGKKVKEMGDVSRAAYGMAGDGVDNLSTEMKKFNAAVVEVNSAGVGWKGTLDTIDGAVVESMRDLIAAGVAIKTLETYYGLTATQGKAFTDMLKDEGDELKQEQRSWFELQKVTAEYFKAVNAASHDSTQRQIDDAYLTASARIEQMIKAKAYSLEAEMLIWKAADQTANNIIQKTLEADARSKDHFEKLAQQAETAYTFAIAHVERYKTADIEAMRVTADAARRAADNWTAALDPAIDTTTAKVEALIGGFHRLAMASPSSTVGSFDAFKAASIEISKRQGMSQGEAEGKFGDSQFGTGTSARGYLPSHLDGGPTQEGPAYLHGGEFVVPKDGALIRGGGTSIVLTVHATMPAITDAHSRESSRVFIESVIIDALKTRVHLGSA